MNTDYIFENIKERIEKIKCASNDYEAAHSIEDKLYIDFVEFVSENSTDMIIKNMAIEILKTKNIIFTRHCG